MDNVKIARDSWHMAVTKCLRNGGVWCKVKVLSFKIRFLQPGQCRTSYPTTAHAQTLLASRQNK